MAANLSPAGVLRVKIVVFLLCLTPLLLLVWRGFNDALGANPIETITRYTGTWTFNFLLITLCVTPLRKIADLPWLIRLRRMFGLYVFFYACLHFTTYFWLDQFFDFTSIARDIVKRPFITVGFAAFVLLIPLAITSNNALIRRIGGRNWQRLHYAVYLIGVLACIHYFWQVKPPALPYPIAYSSILAILLGWRVWNRLSRAA